MEETGLGESPSPTLRQISCPRSATPSSSCASLVQNKSLFLWLLVIVFRGSRAYPLRIRQE